MTTLLVPFLSICSFTIQVIFKKNKINLKTPKMVIIVATDENIENCIRTKINKIPGNIKICYFIQYVDFIEWN